MSGAYIKQAHRLRRCIENAMQSLSGNDALEAVELYPEWTEDMAYSAGHKVRRGGKLWKCIQSHTAMSGWEPENVPSLWEQINETHTGELTDPIPYEGNMALVAGLHYIQDGVIYRCTRDTGNPVYNPLADLVGLYVEVIA